MYKDYFKTLLDFSISAIALFIISPLFIILTILLAIQNKGSAFFFQHRPGKKGELFTVLKFKTMNDKRDALGNLLPDSERITTLGKFIRKSSLDELPQLLNVIKGDMSLIGPRPLLTEYLPLYNNIQKRRHQVKPGITGWAQVNGRNAISWQRKFEYDIWYIDHLSFLLDIKIIGLTVKKVIQSEGINQPGHATAEDFNGYN